MTQINGSEVMTIQEVADYLKIHVMTAYRQANRGELPFMFQIGAQWRTHFEKVDAWVDSRIADRMNS